MKRILKNFTLIVCAVLTATVIFTSCNKDQESLIVGTWEQIDNTYTATVDGKTLPAISLTEPGESVIITFNEDNTYKNVYKALEGESITEGTWKIQGKKLTMIANNSEDDGEELATTLTCDIEKLTRKNLSLSYSESGTDDDGEEFSAIIKLTYKRTK